MSPPSWTSLPPVPPLSVVTELSESYGTFSLAGSFTFVVYMFPCYSPRSSHPLLPFLRPQVCSLYLHLPCKAGGFLKRTCSLCKAKPKRHKKTHGENAHSHPPVTQFPEGNHHYSAFQKYALLLYFPP